jgi:signal transduction histidine kinase
VTEQPYPEPLVSALTALRQARADRVTMSRRRATLIRLVAAAGISASIWWSNPRPGLNGASLGIMLAACAFIPMMVTAVWLGMPLSLLPARGLTTRTYAYVAVLALLIMSSIALELLQPSGPAPVGLFLSISITGRVFGPRYSAVLFAAYFAFIISLGLAGITDWNGLTGVGGLSALVAVFIISLFVRRIQAQTEREDQLLAKLEESQKAELRNASLAERQRLAREMHDVLAHSLSGLVIQLEGTRLLAAAAPADPGLPNAIDRAHQFARNGLDEARQAVSMLRGDALPDPRHLADALTADIGVLCQYSEAGTPRDLIPAMRLTLYRVTQEALTNVRKHAHPDKVEIRLEYLPKAVTLTIQDFGTERPAESATPDVPATGDLTCGRQLAHGTITSRCDEPARGYGLTGMRERARLLGGSLDASRTQDGFRVQLRLPT